MIQLKEIRKELGITQKQLAQELSISIPQISRYEAGDTAMTPETIIKICNYLGVTADQLLGHHPIPIYPIYRDASWIHESDVAPDILNSVLKQMTEHLSFLEKELDSIHTLIETSKSHLSSLEKTEVKIESELKTMNSYYNSLISLLHKLETSVSVTPDSSNLSHTTQKEELSYLDSTE
ncbi:MAG: helix-turn-helix domain-containing protein [Firmicutes bacterium]|uniref:Helix-turn-helix domain-containing protein n=1 Tax=Candidatus Scybalomonas excrementavium TaxID=2840943 RepID=A0A9D9HZ28_9FIRM|nr:helix-turn-helix domain-containing protein [Candidatus Scybalomonas excrementavium]